MPELSRTRMFGRKQRKVVRVGDMAAPAPLPGGAATRDYAGVGMSSSVRFEWDETKAQVNLRKHGIRFADAVAAFEDDAALSREDPDAVGEQRFVATGLDHLGHLLTVVYTYRSGVVRLISARRATRKERQAYERRGVGHA